MAKRKRTLPDAPRLADSSAHGPVRPVSSKHLISTKSPEMSELEFGLIMASNAFNRWVVRCMVAAGLSELTTLDVLVLHHVHHLARPKKTADICFILNIEDTHTVTYSLRKLVGLNVITGEKVGKEVFYRTNELGQKYIESYREVRESCLMASLKESLNDDIGRAAQLLRTLSGLYDQAARAAVSL